MVIFTLRQFFVFFGFNLGNIAKFDKINRVQKHLRSCIEFKERENQAMIKKMDEKAYAFIIFLFWSNESLRVELDLCAHREIRTFRI